MRLIKKKITLKNSPRAPLHMTVKVQCDLIHIIVPSAMPYVHGRWQICGIENHPITIYCQCRRDPIPGSPCTGKRQAPKAGSPISWLELPARDSQHMLLQLEALSADRSQPWGCPTHPCGCETTVDTASHPPQLWPCSHRGTWITSVPSTLH